MPLLDRLIKTLPEGASPEDILVIQSGYATVEPAGELTDDEVLVKAGYVKAGPPVLNAAGQPTVMKIVAWMAHEGINMNRQAFLAADLQALAPTLFREPNFGVMDFNHSAARVLFNEEPKIIGVWYKAEYRYDEAAQRYGLLATGMMFSWLFPDHADSLLADQERLGHMRFSMMALPRPLEDMQDENGAYSIIHNPAFMSVSALDVNPADMHSVGVGSETIAVTEEGLRQRLITAALDRPWQQSSIIETITDASKPEGAAMDEQKLVELTEAKTKLDIEVAQLREANITLQRKYDDAIVAHDTEVAEFTQAVEELKRLNEELGTKVTETEVARDSANSERDAVTAKIAELETELNSLKEFKATTDAEVAKQAAEVKLAARKAKLPESYLEAFSKRPAERQAALEEKWLAMEDDAFEAYLEDELGYVPNTKLSYFERSRREEVLPTQSEDVKSEEIGERVRRLLATK